MKEECLFSQEVFFLLFFLETLIFLYAEKKKGQKIYCYFALCTVSWMKKLCDFFKVLALTTGP